MTREEVINLAQARLARNGVVVKRTEIGSVLDDIVTVVGEDAKANNEVYDFTLPGGTNTIQMPSDVLYVNRVIIDGIVATKHSVDDIIKHNGGEI